MNKKCYVTIEDVVAVITLLARSGIQSKDAVAALRSFSNPPVNAKKRIEFSGIDKENREE